jgi:hypothetical protein
MPPCLTKGNWLTSRVGGSLLIVAPVVCVLALPARAGDLVPDIELGTLQIKVEFVADCPNVFQPATGLGHAGDGSGRLFLAERDGRVFIIDDGVVLPEPFLDLSASPIIGPGLHGLFGFAFHTDYADSKANGFGKLYTYHTGPPPTWLRRIFPGPRR